MAILTKKDIQKCSSCHGNPIRPIWGNYPSWPNAFGSVDDFLPDPTDPGKGSPYYRDHEKSLFEEDRLTENFYGDGYSSNQPRLTDELLATAIKESEQFRVFREKAKEDPRYGPLEEASDSSSPVYPYSENYRTRNIAFRPNLYIGSMMALRQNEILQNTLKNNPAYSKFKSLTFVYNHCRPEEVSDGFYNQIYEFIATRYKRVYGREIPLEFNKDTQSYSLQSDHFVDIFGLRPHQKTFMFADNIDYLGEMERNYFGGYTSLLSPALSNLLEEHLRTWEDQEKFVSDYEDEYLTDEMLKEQREQFPFTSYFQSEFLGAEIYNKLQYSFGGRQILANNNEYASEEQKELHKEMCLRLEDESKKVLVETDDEVEEWFKTEVGPSTPWPTALNSCIECHDSGETSVAPIIPLKDQLALAEFNKNYFSNFGWGDFSDAVFLMTLEGNQPAHHGGLRMPLGRVPLKPQEVQEILDWIQGR